MTPHWKKAIVVGASGGIGEHLARQLSAQGCSVVLVGRRRDRLEALAREINGESLNLAHVVCADVRDFSSAEEKFEECVSILEGLDLIIYAAGVMPLVAPNEYNTQKDVEIIETNLIGAMAWLNPAAKRFERARGGTIVGIGSVAGDRGRRGNPAYAASKAGLECYLESLRNRLSRFGVSVVTVKPGPVATPMTALRGPLPGTIPADLAARLILRASRRFGSTAYIPWRWYFVSKILRALPSVVFRRLSI
jgi:short-subunit dehydrogenase